VIWSRAELACRARRTKEEDFVLVLVLPWVSVDEVAAPTASSFVRLAPAFGTDERLCHIRTLVDVAADGKMSKTAYCN
jgi:hypothetical protein